MNILMLCNKSPYPPQEGGPMAMNSMVTGLIEAGHKVKVLAVNSEKYHIDIDKIPADYKEKTRIELVDVDLRVKPWQAFKNLFSDKSYHVERFVSEDFKVKLVNILKKEKFDIVQLEMIYMASYIETIRSHSKAVIVLRTHNIEHLIWERIAKKTWFCLKRWYINHLARTLRKYEFDVINKVDGIASITYRDAAFFRSITNIPVVDIPFGIDVNAFKPSFKIHEKPTFFHIGSMNWMPNEEAMKWLVSNIWDKVVERNPEVEMHLAGRNMPKWLQNIKRKNLVVDGEVPDAKKFVVSHDVAVVPLLSGSGMRIKIIEAMAMGKTVITTMIGAEGIQYSEYENIIIADTAEKMVETMVRIVNEPAEAERIGRNARTLVENLYDNKKIINRLLLFYNELVNKKQITILNEVAQ